MVGSGDSRIDFLLSFIFMGGFLYGFPPLLPFTGHVMQFASKTFFFKSWKQVLCSFLVAFPSAYLTFDLVYINEKSLSPFVQIYLDWQLYRIIDPVFFASDKSMYKASLVLLVCAVIYNGYVGYKNGLSVLKVIFVGIVNTQFCVMSGISLVAIPWGIYHYIDETRFMMYWVGISGICFFYSLMLMRWQVLRAKELSA